MMEVILDQPPLHRVCLIDRVGPVDNRPSTKLVGPLCQKKIFKKFNQINMIQGVTWHITRDTLYLMPEMWHKLGGKNYLKISTF